MNPRHVLRIALSCSLVLGWVLPAEGLAGSPESTSKEVASRPRPVPGGKELLTASSAAMSRAQSYQVSGTLKVAVSGGKGQSVPEQHLQQSGAYQSPKSIYSRSATVQPRPGSLETFTDSTGVYGKVTGETKVTGTRTDTWVKLSSQTASRIPSNNPLTGMQLLSTSGEASAPVKVELDGKTYSSVQVRLTSEQVKALLGTALAAAEAAVSASLPSEISSVSQAEGTATYYIDPQTLIAEVCRYEGREVLKLKDGSSSNLSFGGELKVSGWNQPVTLPDVSGATMLPPPSLRQN